MVPHGKANCQSQSTLPFTHTVALHMIKQLHVQRVHDGRHQLPASSRADRSGSRPSPGSSFAISCGARLVAVSDGFPGLSYLRTWHGQVPGRGLLQLCHNTGTCATVQHTSTSRRLQVETGKGRAVTTPALACQHLQVRWGCREACPCKCSPPAVDRTAPLPRQRWAGRLSLLSWAAASAAFRRAHFKRQKWIVALPDVAKAGSVSMAVSACCGVLVPTQNGHLFRLSSSAHRWLYLSSSCL